MVDERSHDLSIGVVAERSGVNVETILFYEKTGLLGASPKTASGHLNFGLPEVKRLVFIRRARELGFGLVQVREMLALADGSEHACPEVEKIGRDLLKKTNGFINDLGRIKLVLAKTVARCAGGTVPVCPILETLYKDGEGPLGGDG